MQSLIKILNRNPQLIRIESLKEKKVRDKYEKSIKYDKLSEVAKQYSEFVLNIPKWKVDRNSIEKNFNFGVKIVKDYSLCLQDIEKLFNEILPKYFGGGFIGFFISGAYHEIISDNDTIKFNLGVYPASISGLGFRHPIGRVEIIGDRAYYVGMLMTGGEIYVFGNTGNYIGKEMKGGRIIVYGNARNFIGDKMEGGSILIKGNALDAVGMRMTGGQIIIEGTAGYWIGEGAKGGVIKIQI
ncbi:MAG: hypothetical protein ABDH16_00590 [Thermodesulfovibrionaceae bacterium]